MPQALNLLSSQSLRDFTLEPLRFNLSSQSQELSKTLTAKNAKNCREVRKEQRPCALGVAALLSRILVQSLFAQHIPRTVYANRSLYACFDRFVFFAFAGADHASGKADGQAVTGTDR